MLFDMVQRIRHSTICAHHMVIKCCLRPLHELRIFYKIYEELFKAALRNFDVNCAIIYSFTPA